jgi:hypothetical protein
MRKRMVIVMYLLYTYIMHSSYDDFAILIRSILTTWMLTGYTSSRSSNDAGSQAVHSSHNEWIKNYRFGRMGVFVEVSLAEFGQCTPGNKWYQRLREL